MNDEEEFQFILQLSRALSDSIETYNTPKIPEQFRIQTNLLDIFSPIDFYSQINIYLNKFNMFLLNSIIDAYSEKRVNIDTRFVFRLNEYQHYNALKAQFRTFSNINKFDRFLIQYIKLKKIKPYWIVILKKPLFKDFKLIHKLWSNFDLFFIKKISSYLDYSLFNKVKIIHKQIE